MEATTASFQQYIRPITGKKKSFYILCVLAAGGVVYWLYHCALLLIYGHVVTGTASYGATWGITVANLIHVIGISHVGIAISATVRILKLERYRNVARLAEFVTLIALITAVINIALDVGRSERFIVTTLVYGKWYAPMVWSMTVITLYLFASCTYLYLSMRRDFGLMATKAPRYQRLYKILALGYEDTESERKKHEHTLFWLALCLIPIMISVHSVYGLFFGLLPAKAGWFNPLQAPYFVLGAIVSGFSAILIILAILRWAYSWQELLPDRLFKVFGIFLAFVVFLYLYFLITEQLTAQYAAPYAEKEVSNSLLTGEFSGIFWWATIGGLVIPFIYLFVQGVRKNFTSVIWTTAAAILINIALWAKRYLIVVPAQYELHLPGPRPMIPYTPTFTEWMVTLGSYFFAIFLFLILLKFIPIIEIPAQTKPASGRARKDGSSTRALVMWVTLIVGVLLIIWGALSRDFDYAPIKWLLGIIFLVAIPLERCLIKDAPAQA